MRQRTNSPLPLARHNAFRHSDIRLIINPPLVNARFGKRYSRGLRKKKTDRLNFYNLFRKKRRTRSREFSELSDSFGFHASRQVSRGG